MTRDEAKQRCASLLGAMDRGMHPDDRATLLVDGFALLGMLKLDEPKSKLDDFWIALGYRKGSVLPHDIAHMLDEFKLKIVEK